MEKLLNLIDSLGVKNIVLNTIIIGITVFNNPVFAGYRTEGYVHSVRGIITRVTISIGGIVKQTTSSTSNFFSIPCTGPATLKFTATNFEDKFVTVTSCPSSFPRVEMTDRPLSITSSDWSWLPTYQAVINGYSGVVPIERISRVEPIKAELSPHQQCYGISNLFLLDNEPNMMSYVSSRETFCQEEWSFDSRSTPQSYREIRGNLSEIKRDNCSSDNQYLNEFIFFKTEISSASAPFGWVGSGTSAIPTIRNTFANTMATSFYQGASSLGGKYIAAYYKIKCQNGCNPNTKSCN